MGDRRWQPSASLDRLKQSAELRSFLREWLAVRGVLEVSTPVLSAAATTDPNIDSFETIDAIDGETRYLQTSPEFAMKRLLSAYQADLYQVASVFRAGEIGRYHNPEFTMLEWYRCGVDHRALMDEVEALLHDVATTFNKAWQPSLRIAYHDVVESLLGRPLTQVDVPLIGEYFERHERSFPESIGRDRDAALDLLIDEFLLPTLPNDRLSFLFDYPSSQAALARCASDSQGRAIAERFEVYVGRLELANGFHELSDADEQRIRFESDLDVRRRQGKPLVPMDHSLVSALQFGLPDCAGVALGIERLLMVLCGAEHINEVLAFDVSRA